MSTGPGYGRGGRGAALQAALNAPVRKPGSSPPSGSPKSKDAPSQPVLPTPAPLGRGAMLRHLQEQATKPQPIQPTVPPAMPPAVPPTVAPTPQPFGRGAMLTAGPKMGRGAAALLQQQAKPLGRGVAGIAAAAAAASTAASPPPPASPARTATPPQVASPAQVAAPPAQQAAPDRGGSGDRPSRLARMLGEMSLDEPNVNRASEGERVPVACNFIPIMCDLEGVFQYHVSFSPPVDSRNLRAKLLYSLDIIGDTRAFDGAILFLPRRLPKEETIATAIKPMDNAEVNVCIKLVRCLPPQSCIQMYNVIFRRAMSHLKLCQIKRHYYDPHSPASLPNHKLEVWPGYVTAINSYEGGLMLMADVSHRVLRTETVLDKMYDLHARSPETFQRDIQKELIGCTILTRYNNRTYRIDDIDFTQNPSTEFQQSNGQSMTFVQYYQDHYNKVIKDKEQPLLINRPKKQENTRGKPQIDMICLVPELCYLTGLTDKMREDFRVMKDLAGHTRVKPNNRQIELRKFIENLNSQPEARAELSKWGLKLHPDILQEEARLLPSEKILWRNRQVPGNPEADFGRSIGKEHVINAVPLRNWVVVVTQRNERQAGEFIDMMMRVMPQMGMEVERPNRIPINNDRTETYLQAVRSAINPQLQLVVTIFPTSRDDRYNAIKKLCYVEAPVSSQVLNFRTISDGKKMRSVAQKVALQINAKLGGELWAVDIPVKNMMVAGIDVYHDKGSGNSVGGFVASMNRHCTQWYTTTAQQPQGAELMTSLRTCMIDSLKEYHKANHALPEKIVIFRDGVGDGQLKVVSEFEVKQFEDCFKHFGETYTPKLCVVVVQKRINERIFAVQRRGRDSLLDNPGPGTVMDHTITRRNWFDFFLVSQHVRQGTVSPTHYVVIHDGLNWGPGKIQKLAYKMTHLYYNWPGTVRVPAPCQYAHRIAYMVGQNLKRTPAPELANKLFYL